MPRLTKALALDLIVFAKKLSVRANYFDRKATSAFEFVRQMNSPNLKKVNPSFEVSFVEDVEFEKPAQLRAEFIDGAVWETETGSFKASDLRNEVKRGVIFDLNVSASAFKA